MKAITSNVNNSSFDIIKFNGGWDPRLSSAEDASLEQDGKIFSVSF